MIPFAAYLRVYEPLDGLAEPDRRRWSAYIGAGRPVPPERGVEREHDASLRALLSQPPYPVPGPDEEGAFVHQSDGSYYICPWLTTVRSWMSLREFRRSLPEELADAFVPRGAVAAAEEGLVRWQEHHPDRRPGILTSTWSVPVGWFLLFHQEERQLLLGARRGGGGARTVARGLRYMAPMSRARQRLARALHVLRRALPDGPVASTLADLGRWLEDFHPHSLVELDYGGLVHLLDDEALAGDDSVPVLAEALGCLAGGDPTGAVARYQRVVARWRAVAALESAN